MTLKIVYAVVETRGGIPDVLSVHPTQEPALAEAVEQTKAHGFDPTGFLSPDDALQAFNDADPEPDVYLDVHPVPWRG